MQVKLLSVKLKNKVSRGVHYPFVEIKFNVDGKVATVKHPSKDGMILKRGWTVSAFDVGLQLVEINGQLEMSVGQVATQDAHYNLFLVDSVEGE